jgi:hypothetical protein
MAAMASITLTQSDRPWGISALFVIVFQLEQVFPQLPLQMGVRLQVSLHRRADALEFAFHAAFGLLHARRQKHFPVADFQALLGHLHRSGGHAHGIVDHPAQGGHGLMKGTAGKIHGRDAQKNPHQNDRNGTGVILNKMVASGMISSIYSGWMAFSDSMPSHRLGRSPKKSVVNGRPPPGRLFPIEEGGAVAGSRRQTI